MAGAEVDVRARARGGGESRGAKLLIWSLSAFVFLAVGVAIYVLPHDLVAEGEAAAKAGTVSTVSSSARTPSGLATTNAVLNGLATVLLVIGYFFIRHRRVRAHRATMLAAFGVSTVFLVTYLLHHARVGSVSYRGEGLARVAYFSVLIPHVVLAGLVVPLALFSIYRGYTGRIAEHRRIVRWTLPIWLYVSLSGVIVYFMLYAH